MSQEKNNITEICYKKIKGLESDITCFLEQIRQASNLISEYNKKIAKWKDTIDKMAEKDYNHFIIDTEFTTYIVKLKSLEVIKDGTYHFEGNIGIFANNDRPKFGNDIYLDPCKIKSIIPITEEQFKDKVFEGILENNRDVLKRLKDATISQRNS
jgi:hypothetical protein